jgi:hypothetical protein
LAVEDTGNIHHADADKCQDVTWYCTGDAAAEQSSSIHDLEMYVATVLLSAACMYETGNDCKIEKCVRLNCRSSRSLLVKDCTVLWCDSVQSDYRCTGFR